MFRMSLGSGESGGHVVSLRGELDLVDATAVATALEAVAARDRWIIVDLSGLEFIDAVGAPLDDVADDVVSRTLRFDHDPDPQA
jgi:anti-anti-sigma factor